MSRDKRRYHERLSDLQNLDLTLDDVTQAGNLTTRGAYFDGDLEATGYVKGDGIHLTNLPSVTAVTGLTLDDVVTNGNVCTVSGAKFNGDLEASGFIKGDGIYLTNLPFVTSTGALTLDDIVTSGNVCTVSGAKFNGDLEASGFIKGNGSLLTNLGYMTSSGTLTLDDVVTGGNVCTVSGAKFNGDLEASGFVKGNGSLLTNLGYMTSTGLDDVTTQGSSTNRKISFTNTVTSLETSGNVLVSGNATCSQPLKGNGEFLTGVANSYNLSLVNTSVTSVEGKKIITNTSSLTDVTQGDILISTANGTLGKLPIGTNGKVLYSNPTSLQPEWKTFTDIFNVSSRTSTLVSKAIFADTPNLSSLTTGDILYGYANNDIRRLSRVTTAPNTWRSNGDYGTGYGRLLRMDETGKNIMWLHPTNGLDSDGTSHLFETSGNLLKIRTRLSETWNRWTDRIEVSVKSFDIKFANQMFFSINGTSYLDTYSSAQSGFGHPNNIKYHCYLLGKCYFNACHGDGSGLYFGSAMRGFSFSNTPNTGPNAALGKNGSLLTFSDRRRKSNIKNISNALEKLSKLVPKIYDMKDKRTSGFIAQEVYYDAREMRHIVWPDRDASPNDDAPEPDYSDWGKRMACLKYLQPIAYIVKSIQELRVRIEKLKNNKQ